MARKEERIILHKKDKDGNTIYQFPYTKGDCIETPVPIKAGGLGSKSVQEALEVLGLDATVQNLSISGKTITVTFKDGTTKTLTTQDTVNSNVVITEGTIADGGTIPLPSGYTRAQCKYAVWAHDMPDANGDYGHGSWHRTQVDQNTGVVYVKYCYENVSQYQQSGTAGYLCIAVK